MRVSRFWSKGRRKWVVRLAWAGGPALLISLLNLGGSLYVERIRAQREAPRIALEERVKRLELEAHASEMRRGIESGLTQWDSLLTRFRSAATTDTLPAQRAWWKARLQALSKDLQSRENALAAYEGRVPRAIAQADSLCPAAVTDLRVVEREQDVRWAKQVYAEQAEYIARLYFVEP